MNKNLHKARLRKDDEFYTQLADIEREMLHYRKYFKNKVVFCNCDDPWVSNFFHYFSHHFEFLGLKKLITTCYQNDQMQLFSRHDQSESIRLEYDGPKNGNRVADPKEIGVTQLKGNGDFRSDAPKTELRLNLGDTKNNQKKRVRMAMDYLFNGQFSRHL